ncbi:hypothetical protein GLYMA_09G131050v4 [Glycine max]|nr:hypothetical protein GLYMA_09G131050v4 [Glycine max]KAH1042819.1 hypothetical protein GYH30_024912 [Glycine max]
MMIEIKKEAMKTAFGLSGFESISVDVKDMKLVLLGEIYPASAVSKLRKLCHTTLVTFGPAKEEKKDHAIPRSLPTLSPLLSHDTNTV